MPAVLRERFGPVVPTWERDEPPRPPDDGRPDTPERIDARRDALNRALWGTATVHTLSTGPSTHPSADERLTLTPH